MTASLGNDPDLPFVTVAWQGDMNALDAWHTQAMLEQSGFGGNEKNIPRELLHPRVWTIQSGKDRSPQRPIRPSPPKNMNSDLITSAARATLSGSLPFPQIVGMLLEAGVESYHVDYLSLRKTFYGGDGATVGIAIPLAGLPEIAPDFNAGALRANILDSQQNHQSWRDFTIRAMQGGVQGYFAFLRGQRVSYYGRQGDQHTEWFPGKGPAPVHGGGR